MLIFNPQHDPVIRDYYLYVVSLLTQALRDQPQDVDVLVGEYSYPRRADRKVLRIDFQIEHTLVKPGGRGSEGSPEGVVPMSGDADGKYLVRVQHLARLQRADSVIEYSRPNLINLRTSGLYPELLARMYYIAPLVYGSGQLFSSQGRDLEVITLFGNPEEPRRKVLLEQLRAWNPVCRNIQGRFDDIQDIYRRTRILVNIRQTDHHDTLEELRVLPALLSGVIVISEDVPLRSEVPYHDFILWAPLQDLPALVRHVYENYAHYYERVFSGSALRQCLFAIEEANSDAARRLVTQMEVSRSGR